MVEIDKRLRSYLKRFYGELDVFECEGYTYKELYEDEYPDILCDILSKLHSSFNGIFKYMNSQVKWRYFHAAKSREAINLFSQLNILIEQLKTKGINLTCEYVENVDEINQFIQNSGGTQVPEDFQEIEIIEMDPIFYSNNINLINKTETDSMHLQPVGKGSYAEVFKFTDEFYDKHFILKRGLGDLTTKEVDRFKCEYQTMKKLDSPYIVEVYKYNEEKIEYIMEFMDCTLKKYIEDSNNDLDINSRIRVVNQILRAFEYLQTKNILHRDISPTNVLIKKYENVCVVKIADFGMVKLQDSEMTSENTELKGSLNDPKLKFTGFQKYEIRHETYALTQLIAYVLTGKTNFSKIKDEKIKKFLNKGVLPIDQRYQTFDELKEAFSRLREELIN